MKAIVFDIDGVLIDPQKRLRKCLEKVNATSIKKLHGKKRKEFWDCFLSETYMNLDEPIQENIAKLREMKDKGYYIILITGRREDRQKNKTLEQLDEWNIPYNKIYFRKAYDKRRDYVYKSSLIKKLIRQGFEIIEVWDDSEKVIEKLKQILPNAKIVIPS